MDLLNFIKYCLGYVKIARDKTIVGPQKDSLLLSNRYFNLLGLLNGDTDGKVAETINLELFYEYDPYQIPEEDRSEYNEEKKIANKIEEIVSKYRNNQFTKQILLSFGFFEIELPINTDDVLFDADDTDTEVETTIDRYPLFSIPVKIEKDSGVYSIYSVDPEVHVNISMLETILGEDLYYELLEKMGVYEMDGKLSLPIVKMDIFYDIWHDIKRQLKLKEAGFDEDSFNTNDVKLSINPKANYFLAEDLAKLSKLTEEDLNQTALSSWTSDEYLNEEGGIPYERNLYFPFLYDKYQLSTLSILANKSAIVQGPPGTGKSETISNILCHLAANGNRVLFVSQKAQALKVVKDKLNSLNIKYLYGYIPNPSSTQIGEEDEADGIAPQLSGIGSFVDNLVYQAKLADNTNLNEIVDRIAKTRNNLNEELSIQRNCYSLYQELKGLKEFNIEINNLEKFTNTFSYDEWNYFKKLLTEIALLKNNVTKYEENKTVTDNKFPLDDLKGYVYSDSIKKYCEDIKISGYDRHSITFRKLNNSFRNFRLRSFRKNLPREIIDSIDDILNSDISRSEAVTKVNSVLNYCIYLENKDRLESLYNELNEKLNDCGISFTQFKTLASFIKKGGEPDFNIVKNSILRVFSIKNELKTILNQDGSSLNLDSKEEEKLRNNHIAQYIQNIVSKNILSQWQTGQSVRKIIQKLSRAFGKSKKAFKTFDNIRKDPDNFKTILKLIPIWIMELDDASRIIPLENELFDYVLLDEASQCNVAYTLPVMFRSRKALFVGDSEQMRDNTIMFKSNRVFDELAARYSIPEELQIKATGSSVQSVLDIAKNRGFIYKTLHYHYRSPKELIEFSNKNFYKPNGKNLIPLNSHYLTYKDTNRILNIHKVIPDLNIEISDNVNVTEANGILSLFQELRSDEKYKDKSIGILTFFNAQASYIRDLFEKNNLNEDRDNFKISIIEGIQGDEKDIIIYSFVIRSPDQKNRYIPLTGEGGDIRGDINKGRVNVAFSRAKLQVHCFTSMDTIDVPNRIWIKKYLEYIEEYGRVDINSITLKPFDSYFEEEFYYFIRNSFDNNYTIQNQVESCGFKIDFVISNIINGNRIAVECDGPTHFQNEVDEIYGIYIDSDEERQRVLEAAGWEFYRIKYSDWINDRFDRNKIIMNLANILK